MREPGFPIFTSLTQQTKSRGENIEHYKNPSWLRAALQLGGSVVSSQRQESVLYLEMLLSLLKPYEAYPTITEVLTPSFIEDKKNRDSVAALFGCVFRNFHRSKESAHLHQERRWLTLYLSFTLQHDDPSRATNLSVIEQLGLSPDELLHVLPSSLFTGGPPPHARALFIYLAKRPWLCAAPAWKTHLQSWRALYPEEIEEIFSHQEPLSSLTNNAGTTPELLQESAKSPHKEIRRSVAKNPNTPFPVLFSLAGDFPEEFIENPALELLLLEDANFLESFVSAPAGRIDLKPFVAVLSHPSAPSWLLGMILTRDCFRYDWRSVAIQHPNTPQDLIESIVRAPGYEADVRRHAIRRAASFDRETLIEFLTGDAPLDRVEAAKRCEAPKDIIVGLNRLGSPDLCAYEPSKVDASLSADLLRSFSRYGFFARIMVAQHPSCPEDVLLQLAKDSDSLSIFFKLRLCYHIAKHPNCPHALLEQWVKATPLADPSHESIDVGVLQSPNVTPELLSIIAHKNYGWSAIEHAMAALHPRTPAECLSQLAKGQALVRSNVAKNSNTPLDVLRRLSKDPHKGVKLSLMENPALAEELLTELSKSSEQDVLVAVACHEKTPATTLLEIARRAKAPRIKNMLVQNENTPNEALQILWQDKNNRLRREIQKHPNYGSHPTSPGPQVGVPRRLRSSDHPLLSKANEED